MRKLLSLLLLMLASCVADPEPETWSLTVGDALPPFSVMTLAGETVSTESLRGSTAVICFFNTSCPDCREELPKLQKAYDVYPSVRFICISRSEDAESVARYWSENGLTLPVSAQPDDKTYRLFASSVIPRVYVADAQGIITAAYAEGKPISRQDSSPD